MEKEKPQSGAVLSVMCPTFHYDRVAGDSAQAEQLRDVHAKTNCNCAHPDSFYCWYVKVTCCEMHGSILPDGGKLNILHQTVQFYY